MKQTCYLLNIVSLGFDPQHMLFFSKPHATQRLDYSL